MKKLRIWRPSKQGPNSIVYTLGRNASWLVRKPVTHMVKLICRGLMTDPLASHFDLNLTESLIWQKSNTTTVRPSTC